MLRLIWFECAADRYLELREDVWMIALVNDYEFSPTDSLALALMHEIKPEPDTTSYVHGGQLIETLIPADDPEDLDLWVENPTKWIIWKDKGYIAASGAVIYVRPNWPTPNSPVPMIYIDFGQYVGAEAGYANLVQKRSRFNVWLRKWLGYESPLTRVPYEPKESDLATFAVEFPDNTLVNVLALGNNETFQLLYDGPSRVAEYICTCHLVPEVDRPDSDCDIHGVDSDS